MSSSCCSTNQDAFSKTMESLLCIHTWIYIKRTFLRKGKIMKLVIRLTFCHHYKSMRQSTYKQKRFYFGSQSWRVWYTIGWTHCLQVSGVHRAGYHGRRECLNRVDDLMTEIKEFHIPFKGTHLLGPASCTFHCLSMCSTKLDQVSNIGAIGRH